MIQKLWHSLDGSCLRPPLKANSSIPLLLQLFIWHSELFKFRLSNFKTKVSSLLVYEEFLSVGKSFNIFFLVLVSFIHLWSEVVAVKVFNSSSTSNPKKGVALYGYKMPFFSSYRLLACCLSLIFVNDYFISENCGDLMVIVLMMLISNGTYQENSPKIGQKVDPADFDDNLSLNCLEEEDTSLNLLRKFAMQEKHIMVMTSAHGFTNLLSWTPLDFKVDFRGYRVHRFPSFRGWISKLISRLVFKVIFTAVVQYERSFG